LGLPGGQPPVEVIHSVQLFYELIRDGKIKITKKFTEPCTYQDPCNIARNGGMIEEPRYIINQMCTDFREMQPNREHNFCCSAGGGTINCGPAWKSKRMAGGRVKAEQIRATGAKYVIVPCHNCYDQLNDLSAKYNLGTKAVFFKELLVDHGLMHIPDELRPKKE
jgi:Fe-S oxidoreductase